MSLEAVPTHNGSNSQPLILPVHGQAKNLFNCFYPAAEPTITKIQESILSPTSLVEALTYAVGYIDQSATASKTIKQEYELLEKRYQAATETIKGDLANLEELQAHSASQESRIIELEDTVTVQERFSQRLQRGINKLRTGERSNGDADAPELMETREKLQQATFRAKEFKDKYDAAQKENADLNSKLATESNNNAGLKEDKTRLETSVAAKTQELLTLNKNIAQASAELAAAKHHIDVDGHIIAGIQDEREALARAIREKVKEVEDIKKECAETRKSLKAELDATRAKLELVEDEKKSIEEEHSHCRENLRASEDAKKALQEKLTSVEAELIEAKKPTLPNTAVLKNPITIAGSLKGAPEDIDDKFWPIPELPFPVTIYDHSSKKLFVTDNGMLCFDEDIKKPVDKREGQKLPYYDGVPKYTLFPFWADLKLTKGKPHGIFYEITGEVGARSLTVEWYLTRFQHEDQYFQFTVLFEEAKPNVVTFKYYDAQDKGIKCTVGIQGPDSAMTFSRNEPKIFPGLKLILDTKNNKVIPSNFELR